MTAAVDTNARCYALASESARGTDLALLKRALAGGHHLALWDALEPLRSRPEAGVAALQRAGFGALPADLRTKPHLLRLAPTAGKLLAHALHGSADPLATDVLFQLELVRLCPDALPHVPLVGRVAFVRAALATEPWAVLRLPPRARRHAISSLMPQRRCDCQARREAAEAPASKRKRLAEELECPICKERACGRVLQCRHGHIACDACVTAMPGRIYVCPLCRSAEAKIDLSRNLVAEAFACVTISATA